MEHTVAANGSFDGWYRAEHPRVLGLLTVVAGDVDVGRDVTAEACLPAGGEPTPHPLGAASGAGRLP